MIKPTEELLKEAIDDISEIIDYALSEQGDTNIGRWLLEANAKLAVVYGRLVMPVKQQED
jgi:hypothetical protein